MDSSQFGHVFSAGQILFFKFFATRILKEAMETLDSLNSLKSIGKQFFLEAP